MPRFAKSQLLIVVSVLMLSLSASAEPAENISQVLTRTAASGNTLKASLSKNLYKQVPYEAEYTVQIPYQAEEAYTDYETYYDTEYRCHSETSYERECSNEQVCQDTGGGRQCQQQRVCTGGGQRCDTVQECGTTATGQPICKPRQQCYSVPEDCHYEQQCYDVPGERQCHTEQRCSDVPRSHEVCGNETVQKSRPVTKYRTVTRYREESRCCVTKTRSEYDQQIVRDVEVRFPMGSELQAGEKESFQLSLEGNSQAQAQVKFGIKESILGYEITRQSLEGQVAIVELGLKPKYSEAQVGAATVEGLKLYVKDSGVAIGFVDNGQKSRIQTVYGYQVMIKSSGAIVAQGEFKATGESKVMQPLGKKLDDEEDYVLLLRVARSGVVLAAPVQFDVRAERIFEVPNEAIYKDANQVHSLDLSGEGLEAEVVFRDQAPQHAAVKTSYKVTVLRQSGFLGASKAEMATKIFSQEQARVDASGRISLSLLKDLGVSKADLGRYVQPNYKVYIQLEVTRKSSRLNGGVPIVIAKSATHFIESRR